MSGIVAVVLACGLFTIFIECVNYGVDPEGIKNKWRSAFGFKTNRKSKEIEMKLKRE